MNINSRELSDFFFFLHEINQILLLLLSVSIIESKNELYLRTYITSFKKTCAKLKKKKLQ